MGPISLKLKLKLKLGKLIKSGLRADGLRQLTSANFHISGFTNAEWENCSNCSPYK